MKGIIIVICFCFSSVLLLSNCTETKWIKGNVAYRLSEGSQPRFDRARFLSVVDKTAVKHGFWRSDKFSQTNQRVESQSPNIYLAAYQLGGVDVSLRVYLIKNEEIPVLELFAGSTVGGTMNGATKLLLNELKKEFPFVRFKVESSQEFTFV